jgi:hypothetical protein
LSASVPLAAPATEMVALNSSSSARPLDDSAKQKTGQVVKVAYMNCDS